MMPTEILYRIVIAYLFDRDPELREATAPHFIYADSTKPTCIEPQMTQIETD